jgi:hypothetical protein
MSADLLTPNVRELAASGASHLCADSQRRSENAIETCNAGSRRNASLPLDPASHTKGRDPLLSVVGNAGSRRSASLPLDPASHTKGRDPLLLVVGTRSRAIRANTSIERQTS